MAESGRNKRRGIQRSGKHRVIMIQGSNTHDLQITGKTSCVPVISDIQEAEERAAFLATAKKNASMMFSKYL